MPGLGQDLNPGGTPVSSSSRLPDGERALVPADAGFDIGFGSGCKEPKLAGGAPGVRDAPPSASPRAPQTGFLLGLGLAGGGGRLPGQLQRRGVTAGDAADAPADRAPNPGRGSSSGGGGPLRRVAHAARPGERSQAHRRRPRGVQRLCVGRLGRALLSAILHSRRMHHERNMLCLQNCPCSSVPDESASST